jgi:hypothetical protein
MERDKGPCLTAKDGTIQSAVAGDTDVGPDKSECDVMELLTSDVCAGGAFFETNQPCPWGRKSASTWSFRWTS